MPALLKFKNKKALFYKVSAYVRHSKEGMYTEILAPYPKNKRQKAKLIKFLKDYDGKIIYPDGFYENGMPSPYLSYELRCKLLIKEFLEYSKENGPDCAVICTADCLHRNFYFELSRYVGRIIITDLPRDDCLASEILSYSGTPLQFGGNIADDAVILDLSEKGCSALNKGSLCFDHKYIFNKFKKTMNIFLKKGNNYNIFSKSEE